MHQITSSPSGKECLLPLAAGCLPENNCQEAWHKVAKRQVKGCMRASTSKCLEMSIPLLTRLDGLRMPDHLSFELHSVSTDTLEKAQLLAEDADNTIWSDTEGEYFVLRKAQKKYKKVTDALVAKYRAMLDGKDPPGLPAEDKEKRYDAIEAIAKSLRRVIVAEKGTVPDSTYFNPFKLECRLYF